MASALVSNPYTGQQALVQNPAYTYVAAPQPPPSPPVDETSKCSLPSISSLLGLADGSSPQEPSQQQPPPPPPPAQQTPAQKSDGRPTSEHQYGPSTLTSRGGLPPTPPMQSEAGFDGRQSPSAASNSGYSVVSAPGYYFAPSVSALNNVEPHAQRQPAPTIQRRVSMPATTTMGYAQSFHGSPYTVSPQQAMSSYYPNVMQSTPQSHVASGLYYQRALPQVSSHTSLSARK
ncbi:hypothetical protein B7494_g5712 [Chlorociboria aeruginascens]|nr:hypothetical protein B7494_g5712 [Chlorociboria aeruginascens]